MGRRFKRGQCRRHAIRRQFRFDEFHLRVGKPEFAQFGLNQGPALGVVHQFKVLGKFGIETDGQKIFAERDWMRFQQITSGERTGASDSLNDFVPKLLQVAITHCAGSRGCGRRRRGRARGLGM